MKSLKAINPLISVFIIPVVGSILLPLHEPED